MFVYVSIFLMVPYGGIVDQMHPRAFPPMFLKYAVGQTESSTPERCPYSFYIFIYPLPFIFNAQIFPYVKGLGGYSNRFSKGPGVNMPTIFDGTVNLLQFNTEILLHWLLTKHPCVTSDPEKASFFYLPVYEYYMYLFANRGPWKTAVNESLNLLDQMLRNSSNVDAFFLHADQQAILDKQLILQFYKNSTSTLQHIHQIYPNLPTMNSSQSYPLSLAPAHSLPSFFKSYLYRNQLCDHIFVASRPFMDWDSDYIWQAKSAPQHNIIWLSIERPSQYPLDKYKSSKTKKNIGIPYVVSGELYQLGDIIYQELRNRIAAVGMLPTSIEPCHVFCSENFSTTIGTGVFPKRL